MEEDTDAKEGFGGVVVGKDADVGEECEWEVSFDTGGGGGLDGRLALCINESEASSDNESSRSICGVVGDMEECEGGGLGEFRGVVCSSSPPSSTALSNGQVIAVELEDLSSMVTGGGVITRTSVQTPFTCVSIPGLSGLDRTFRAAANSEGCTSSSSSMLEASPIFSPISCSFPCVDLKSTRDRCIFDEVRKSDSVVCLVEPNLSKFFSHSTYDLAGLEK